MSLSSKPRLSSLTGAVSEQSKNHRDYEVGTTEERTLVSVAGWGRKAECQAGQLEERAGRRGLF